MKLDLDKLTRNSAREDVQYHICTINKPELASLVRIAKAAVLTTRHRQTAPELELLADELREAGLL